MLRSMTGYGRAESVGGDYSVQAEIKTVNGRFLKTHCKLPPQLSRFEPDVDRVLKQVFARGTVDIYLKYERLSNPGGYIFNAEAARGYWHQIKKMQEEFGIDDKASLELLTTLPGVLTAQEETEEEIERLLPHIDEAVRAAAERVTVMREKEGAELKADLFEHLRTVKSLLQNLMDRIPMALEGYKTRLRERIEQLLNGSAQVAEQDLAREVAFYVDRTDISEEIARMASHVGQLEETLNSGAGAVGRQLEFIGQEMHREANTMGSKVSDAQLSIITTSLKSTIDKIREQVLNVE